MPHNIVAMLSLATVDEAAEIVVLVERVKVLFYPAGNGQRAIGFASSGGAEKALRREEEGPCFADFFGAGLEFAFVEADKVARN